MRDLRAQQPGQQRHQSGDGTGGLQGVELFLPAHGVYPVGAATGARSARSQIPLGRAVDGVSAGVRTAVPSAAGRYRRQLITTHATPTAALTASRPS
jgi:hypothetical protein